MGQIPNKTYTAPDGTVYRVEADGSVTKIKESRVQSNEPSSKYQITPDGKIYRVESDGSVTYLGNAEKREPFSAASVAKKSGNRVRWIIFPVIVILVICIGIIVSDQNQRAYYDNTDMTEVSDTSGIYVEDYPSREDVQCNALAQEIPDDDDERYAFIKDGEYYGRIGDVRIHGNLNLASENPSGTLYYTDNGNGASLKIYGSADGRIWSEYYNGDNTGHIDFDFWNLAYRNFARGTYVRRSDGKKFTIKLYKTNF